MVVPAGAPVAGVVLVADAGGGCGVVERGGGSSGRPGVAAAVCAGRSSGG
jgi:hypothetical protein